MLSIFICYRLVPIQHSHQQLSLPIYFFLLALHCVCWSISFDFLLLFFIQSWQNKLRIYLQLTQAYYLVWGVLGCFFCFGWHAYFQVRSRFQQILLVLMFNLQVKSTVQYIIRVVVETNFKHFKGQVISELSGQGVVHKVNWF